MVLVLGERSKSLSIHIRHGNYISHQKVADNFGYMSIDYYKEALKIALSQADYRVFIFSDDLNWVKENLDLPIDAYFVDLPDGPNFADRYLMRLKSV